MARKRMNLADELRKIESEERTIISEERRIEDNESVLRGFEELGLMRWKSYYILTAGAILLLALTFVTSLWVMHDQLVEIKASTNTLSGQIDVIGNKMDSVEAKINAATAPREWCPVGQTIQMANVAPGTGTATLRIVGKEMRSGKEMCRGTIANTELGTKDVYWDQTGNFEVV